MTQELYVHNRKQRFKKTFYVLTDMRLPKTSRSSFSYLSSNKSCVSLLLFFFFAGGKVGALNILIQKIFCYSCRKIVIFWASHFHLPLFLLLQFCKISNRYSFWCFCNQLYFMKFSVTIYNFIVRALRTCSLFLNKMK